MINFLMLIGCLLVFVVLSSGSGGSSGHFTNTPPKDY